MPRPKLEPPDTHHLSAAIGWLELGDHVESGVEISRITPEQLDHPDVLEVRWSVCAAGRSWEAGLAVAEKLVQEDPDRCSGWIHRSYSLRRVKKGGLGHAWEALRPAYERFPKEFIIPYNLACYAAQLGRLGEAWDWLQKATKAAGGVGVIRRMALADPDLEPVWDQVRGL
jgi:hypothetical protein